MYREVHVPKSLISKIFEPFLKSCTCEVRVARGRVPRGLTVTVFLSCWLGLSCNISWYQCNFSLQNFPGLNVLLCISLLLSSINVNISVWCGWCGNYLPFTLQTLGNFKIFVMFSLTPHYKFSSHKREHFILTVAVSSSVLLFLQKEKMSSLIVLTIIYCIAIEVEIFAVDMFQKCRNC